MNLVRVPFSASLQKTQVMLTLIGSVVSETLSLSQASHCNLWSSKLCEKCHRIRVSLNFKLYLISKRKIQTWSNIRKACFTFATEGYTVVPNSKTSITRFQFET